MSSPARPPTSASRSSSSPGRSCTRPGRGPTATRSSSTSSSPKGRWGIASARTQTPTIAELRTVAQPARIFERNSGEHWAGKLYVRRYSPYLTRLLLPTRVTPNAVTWAMIAVGVLGAAALTVPGLWRPLAAFLLIQGQILLDCSDGELARWRQQFSPAGIYLDRFAHYFTETLLPIALGIRADGGWDSIGGYTTLGLVAAVLALLVRIEATLLALAAAIADAVVDGMPFTRGLVIALVPVAAITAAGHLLAILNSSR